MRLLMVLRLRRRLISRRSARSLSRRICLFWGLRISNFQTIHFNLHPSLLHSSMYLEERRSMGFDWIITLIQEFFFSSWSALCIHYRDSTNDLNYTKCWKKEQLNSLIYCYFSLHSSSLKRTVWSFESTIIFRTTILFIKQKKSTAL